MSASFDLALKIDSIRSGDRHEFSANEASRAEIANGLKLVSLDRFGADATLERDGDVVTATGTISAELEQSCIASGEPVPAAIRESYEIEFRPHVDHQPDEEIELEANELDVAFHDGKTIELGKALIDTLALALDPFPRSGHADEVLREAGVKSEEEAGAFGALAALKDKMEKGD